MGLVLVHPSRHLDRPPLRTDLQTAYERSTYQFAWQAIFPQTKSVCTFTVTAPSSLPARQDQTYAKELLASLGVYRICYASTLNGGVVCLVKACAYAMYEAFAWAKVVFVPAIAFAPLSSWVPLSLSRSETMLYHEAERMSQHCRLCNL